MLSNFSVMLININFIMMKKLDMLDKRKIFKLPAYDVGHGMTFRMSGLIACGLIAWKKLSVNKPSRPFGTTVIAIIWRGFGWLSFTLWKGDSSTKELQPDVIHHFVFISFLAPFNTNRLFDMTLSLKGDGSYEHCVHTPFFSFLLPNKIIWSP